ncbi:Uncharacterised protein [Mycobacteroides abscessus subsp. abscessus]|uniref:Uncharacterized protein n=1 Tax=Mycobacteroides abscessus subsp. abscessus TaxID=1185650 RepID=A0AB38D197_9MYCO|nr:hypothetical protein [Mycobacteroides abscessus]SHX07458.1 Uncharacterised protein [Mycobacteroides abscessus subsp. abscessus]SIA10108.1 Uncharacterised protein [Mycobacteroides abscessus subsp. abscessus]SIB12767.1 Uncharacterised protein [Mycobacteroides abscessus subsp. abscessus]SIB15792.1 Uncharacterised protein [Mycobacteroides abscessus subsp. abscessus]SIB16347.1 Uncharacterised protein [Mycobacteroides abscessus subsp. abscessus]
MTIKINCTLVIPRECTFEVSERELDVMVARGVDVTDDDDVADWYRAHLDQEVDGVWFRDLPRIADDHWHSADRPEVEDWWAEGEAPERFWPDQAE